MKQLPPEAEALSAFGRTVLRQLVLGKPERKIAEELGKSAHTVHGHVKLIYRHFGVSSRPELLSLLLRRQAGEITALRQELRRYRRRPTA